MAYVMLDADAGAQPVYFINKIEGVYNAQRRKLTVNAYPVWHFGFRRGGSNEYRPENNDGHGAICPSNF